MRMRSSYGCAAGLGTGVCGSRSCRIGCGGPFCWLTGGGEGFACGAGRGGDRVLDKALEYVRGELAKKGQRDAQAPVAPDGRPHNPPAQANPRAPTRSTVAEAADRSYRSIAR